MLTPGQTLGPYDIVGVIGAGGMGQVYRAHDRKLNRDVAIKVLPDAFASDGERLARFTREAQMLAALNHPNIAAVYGFEESGTGASRICALVKANACIASWRAECGSRGRTCRYSEAKFPAISAS